VYECVANLAGSKFMTVLHILWESSQCLQCGGESSQFIFVANLVRSQVSF
jgi:hypothetical protein